MIRSLKYSNLRVQVIIETIVVNVPLILSRLPANVTVRFWRQAEFSSLLIIFEKHGHIQGLARNCQLA